MKTKITLMVMAGIALSSFNSCALRIGGRVHVPHENHGHHEGGDRDFVQPQDNGTRNSFVAPFKLQTPSQFTVNCISELNQAKTTFSL